MISTEALSHRDRFILRIAFFAYVGLSPSSSVSVNMSKGNRRKIRKGRRTPGPDMTYNQKVISRNPPRGGGWRGAGYIYMDVDLSNLSCEIWTASLEILRSHPHGVAGGMNEGSWKKKKKSVSCDPVCSPPVAVCELDQTQVMNAVFFYAQHNQSAWLALHPIFSEIWNFTNWIHVALELGGWMGWDGGWAHRMRIDGLITSPHSFFTFSIVSILSGLPFLKKTSWLWVGWGLVFFFRHSILEMNNNGLFFDGISWKKTRLIIYVTNNYFKKNYIKY